MVSQQDSLDVSSAACLVDLIQSQTNPELADLANKRYRWEGQTSGNCCSEIDKDWTIIRSTVVVIGTEYLRHRPSR